MMSWLTGRVGVWLRVVGTTVLLLLVLNEVDWNELALAVANLRPAGLIVAALILCGIRVLMAWRLQLVARIYGSTAAFIDCIAMVLSSSLAGFVLPGGVATDVVRGVQLHSLYRSARAATAIVVLDRYFGVLAILVIGMVAGFTFREDLPPGIYPAFVAALSAFLMIPLVGHRMARLLPQRPKIAARVRALILLITDEIRFNSHYLRLFLVSTVIQLLRCAIFVALFHAFDIGVNPLLAFAFVPIMFVVIMLPFTLGGLGVREGILVVLFAPLGAAVEGLVLVGITAHLIELVTALPGAWYLLKGLPGNRRKHQPLTDAPEVLR